MVEKCNNKSEYRQKLQSKGTTPLFGNFVQNNYDKKSNALLLGKRITTTSLKKTSMPPEAKLLKFQSRCKLVQMRNLLDE